MTDRPSAPSVPGTPTCQREGCGHEGPKHLWLGGERPRCEVPGCDCPGFVFAAAPPTGVPPEQEDCAGCGQLIDDAPFGATSYLCGHCAPEGVPPEQPAVKNARFPESYRGAPVSPSVPTPEMLRDALDEYRRASVDASVGSNHGPDGVTCGACWAVVNTRSSIEALFTRLLSALSASEERVRELEGEREKLRGFTEADVDVVRRAANVLNIIGGAATVCGVHNAVEASIAADELRGLAVRIAAALRPSGPPTTEEGALRAAERSDRAIGFDRIAEAYWKIPAGDSASREVLDALAEFYDTVHEVFHSENNPTPKGSDEMDPLTIKLASIAVHAEEMLSPQGHDLDAEAIRGLLSDPEVRGFLDDPANAVLLPRKRDARG